MRSIADFTAEISANNGCKVVCGFPDEISLPFHLAMQRFKGDIRRVMARLPCGAGYMADAYAWLRGNIRTVHVDNNPKNLAQEESNCISVAADAASFLSAMLEISLPEMHALGVPAQESFWPGSPISRLCNFISDVLPENAVVSADASVARGWAGAAVCFIKTGQRLVTPAGCSSLSCAHEGRSYSYRVSYPCQRDGA